MFLRKVFVPAPPVTAKFRDETSGRESDEVSKHFQDAQSKGEVMRALLVCHALFQRIVIDKAPIVSKDQAWKDFRRERVVLNGIVFIPDKVDDSRSEAFGKALHILVERMLRSETKPTVSTVALTAAATSSSGKGSSSPSSSSPSSSSPSSSSPAPLLPLSEGSIISDAILQRGCRTSAGADTFFLVQQLFCVDGTFVTQKTSLHAEEPIIVDVFAVPDDTCPTPMTSDESVKRERSGGGGSRPISASTIASTADQSQPSDASVSSGGTSGSKKKGFIGQLFAEARRNRAASPPVGATKHGKVDISTFGGTGAGSSSSSGSRSRSGSEAGKPAAGRSTMFARVEVKNSFAVYDEAAMADNVVYSRGAVGGSTTSLGGPVPWLEVDTILVDETNFDTMSHSRRVQLVVTAVNGAPYHAAHAHGVGVGGSASSRDGREGAAPTRFAPHATSGGCLPSARDNPNPGPTKKALLMSSVGPVR